MKSTLFALAGLVAAVAASPLVMPAAELSTRDDCTTYCSVAAGCVCRSYPADCTASYLVQSGDTCVTIAKSFGNFTVTQLYKWNPSVGQTCFGLQAYVPVCINTPDYTFVPPVQPPTGTQYTADQTPVPIMPNIVSNCSEFQLIAGGTREDDLAAANGVTEAEIQAWNGNSTTVWADYWACVKA